MEDLFSHPGSTPLSGTVSWDAFKNVTGFAASCSERTTPTDRASLPRQVSLVLAGADRSGKERLTVVGADLARDEGVTTETATQTLRFCSQIGLFTGERG